MSENIDIYFRSLEAFNRAAATFATSDVDAWLAFCRHDSELHTITATYVDATFFCGHSGMREYFRRMSEIAKSIHIDAEDVRDLGDRVLSLGRWQFRGRSSGIDTESQAGWVVTIDDGAIVRVESFNQPREALEAVGLAE